MGQASALVYTVNVLCNERNESLKDGGMYDEEYAKCVPVEIRISRIFIGCHNKFYT